MRIESWRVRLFILQTLLGMLIPVSLFAEEGKDRPGIVEGRDTKGLSMELVPAVRSIKAGKAFQVGLNIKHDEQFHSYWKNSGVGGVPTSIKWKLPEGFSASEIRWPYPEQSMMADYPCFAYKRDVLLSVEITPPQEIVLEEIELSAEVTWMCCASTCYLGGKRFSLSLPKGEGEKDPKWEKAFAESAEQIPVRSEEYKAELLSEENAEEIEVRISAPDGVQLKYVFNADGQTTPDLPYSLVKEKDSQWKFVAKRSQYGSPVSKSFPFVLQSSEGYVELSAE